MCCYYAFSSFLLSSTISTYDSVLACLKWDIFETFDLVCHLGNGLLCAIGYSITCY